MKTRFVLLVALYVMIGPALVAADGFLITIVRAAGGNQTSAEVAQRIRYAVEELGADVDGGIKDGDREYTPLCHSPKLEVSQELVALGAKPRGSGTGEMTLYHCAAFYGDDARLIGWIANDLGVDEDINAFDANGMTALCRSAQWRGLDYVLAFLEAGADPNAHYRGMPSAHPIACALANPRLKLNQITPIIEAMIAAGAVMPE